MGQRALMAVALALGGVLAWLVLVWNPAPDEGVAVPPRGGEFTLQSASGPVSLHDYAGRVVLIFFGYTHCPDICPTSLAMTAQALTALTPGELERVRALFVSVDPERDTPAHLAEYVAYFHPAITGVTGSPAVLAEVAGRYGAAYRKQEVGSASGYLVDHTAFLYLVDQAGSLRQSLPHGMPPAEMVAAIRALLDERR